MQNSGMPDDRPSNKDRKHSHKHHGHKAKHKQTSHAEYDRGSHNELELYGISGTRKRIDAEKESTEREHFASDRRGDPGILQFGTNHAYQVPPYRRTGYGHVLGLARSLKIDRTASTVKEIRFTSSDPTSRARNKLVFTNVADQHDRIVRSDETISDTELVKDYLNLDSKQQGFDDTELSEDSDSPDYRRATKKVKDSKKDLGSGKRAIQTGIPTDLVDRTTWDHRVKSDPSDGQAWLELIKRQDFQSSKRQTRAERVSTAEIKMSMYEKALKHITGSHREDLLRGMLREAFFVLDEEKLAKKWQDTWSKNRHSFGICKDYIDYHQTKGTRFQFDDLRKIYKEALLSLGESKNEQNKQAAAPLNSSMLGRHALYLLLRYTCSLSQAGYTEQAIAIWQATLESHFTRMARKVSEDMLEKFWESEVPRIGEVNAEGLSRFIENGGDIPIEKDDTLRVDIGSSDIQSWLEYEEAVDKLLPARMGDITDEADAFRVVLFADIQPFLINKFQINKEDLLNTFLTFSGLPPLRQDTTEPWTTDPFIFSSILTVAKTDDTAQSDTSSKTRQRLFLSSSCRTTTGTLFMDEESLFSCFSATGSRVTTSQPTLRWLRNVLRHLVDLETDNTHFELLEYYLAFELKFFPQEVRKISKGYLKRFPQALLLYNVHALIDYRVGSVDSAKKVLQIAIHMRGSDPETILLTTTLAWETLELGESSLALEYLLENAETQDEMTIFDRQRSLLASMDAAVLEKQHLVPSYMDCLLLLGYLSNPNPLSAVLSIFQSHLAFIASKMANHAGYTEGLHQSLARLLYYHMQHHPYKPSVIRTAIQQSMAAFPTNTIFLSIFQLNEQRFRINDRVRSVVREVLSRENSRAIGASSPVITHAFAIQAEMSRWKGLGSSLDSIRSAFERAVEDEAIKSCSSIWRQYAEFEISQHTPGTEKGPHRVQSIIFRAIAACPWVRDFYLMAIRYLNDVHDITGYKGVCTMMVERELRVRSPMDEGF